jgi:flagellar hook assembly protein FlgD
LRTTTIATRIGLLVLAAVLVAPVAVVSAAGSGPKVVVIVGPVGSQTASYKADADGAAAAALQYTSNVVKVYTPTATWATAKAALQGASIVIYMGHGNGFPSPYSTTPRPLGQNGIGLNPSAGTDNTTTQYFGETYLANEIRLAPNAVVLLHHLCYASGNSEPGRAEPTISVAQQRVDNYGAGWLRTGARVVIADAHYGSAYYINALFTTSQSIDSIWRGAPGARGNYSSFPSSRTPGALAQMDPQTPTSGFYRAFVGDTTLTSTAVTGGTFAAPAAGFGTPTNADPAAFAVPGAATVATDAAGIYADPGLTPDPVTGGPTALLPAGTPIRLQSRAGSAPDGNPVFQVATLDGTRTGFMTAAGLAPRDSVGPQVLTIEDGGGSFSPNGDGRADVFQLSGTLSEEAAWNVAFSTAAGSIVAQAGGFGAAFGAAWDGTVNGVRAPDGAYRYTVTASDQWGNPPGARSGGVRIDSSGPALAPAAASGLAPTTFSPNGDGLADKVAVDLVASEAGFVDVSVVSAFGQQVRSFSMTSPAGRVRVTWDGSSDGGGVAPDGTYLLTMTPRDAGGNVGTGQARQVSVYTSVSAVRSSLPAIDPRDTNATAPAATTLSFALAAPATITWTVSNAAGRSIFTQYLSTPLQPGAHAFEWSGRDQAGTLVPPGTYYSNVLATDGALSLRTRSPVAVGAFAVTSSDTTPARGQTITITAASAEALRAAPRLTILQPGVASRVVTMTRSGSGYRATIALRRTTRTGSLVLKVIGSDTAGVASTSVVTFPIH